MTTSQVDLAEVEARLKRAAALINDNGWCRGNFAKVIQGRVHYCVIGAINDAFYEEAGFYYMGDPHLQALGYLADSVSEMPMSFEKREVLGMIHEPSKRLVSYNDSVAKDKRQVLRLFNKALARVRADIEGMD